MQQLPGAFHPDYSKHGVQNGRKEFKYSFNYDIILVSPRPVAFMSVPENAEIVRQDQAKKNITVRLQKPSYEDSINLFYRTDDMNEPVLEYAATKGG